MCATRRATFLESKIADEITGALKECRTVRNFTWKEGGVRYETDLLVQVDSYVIIVEAKSGTVTSPARRGAPKRLQRHIRELLVDPAEQSSRLARKLERLLSGDETDDAFRAAFPFDIGATHCVIRLSVTLEDMATVQSNLAALTATGWIPNDVPTAPTMCLSDLWSVFDILSSTPQKLHYLVRRAELEEHLDYVGDEMDLLGLYLASGFNIGEAEFRGEPMVLTGMSEPVDDYYVARDQGVVREKPKLKSTQWWSDIAGFIEKRRPPRWSEAAVMLLNVAPADQEDLESKFKRVVWKVREGVHKGRPVDFVVLVPPKQRSDAFGLLAFRERDKNERHTKIEAAAQYAFSHAHVTRCLVVAVNVDEEHYPYSTLAVLDR